MYYLVKVRWEPVDIDVPSDIRTEKVSYYGSDRDGGTNLNRQIKCSLEAGEKAFKLKEYKGNAFSKITAAEKIAKKVQTYFKEFEWIWKGEFSIVEICDEKNLF